MRRARAGVIGPRPRRTFSPACSAAAPAFRAARPARFVTPPAAFVATAPTSPATAASTAVPTAVLTAVPTPAPAPRRRFIRSSSQSPDVRGPSPDTPGTSGAPARVRPRAQELITPDRCPPTTVRVDGAAPEPAAPELSVAVTTLGTVTATANPVPARAPGAGPAEVVLDARPPRTAAAGSTSTTTRRRSPRRGRCPIRRRSSAGPTPRSTACRSARSWPPRPARLARGAGGRADRVAATAAAVAAEAPLIWGAVLPRSASTCRRCGPASCSAGRKAAAGRRGTAGAPARRRVRAADRRAAPDHRSGQRRPHRAAARAVTRGTAVRIRRASPAPSRGICCGSPTCTGCWRPRAGPRGPASRSATTAAVIGMDADVVVWHDLGAGHWPGERSTLAEYDARFADRLAVATAAADGRARARPAVADHRVPALPVVAHLRGGAGARAGRQPGRARRRGDRAARSGGHHAWRGWRRSTRPRSRPSRWPARRSRTWSRWRAPGSAGCPWCGGCREVPVLRADVEVDVDMESFGESGAYLWGALLAHPGGTRPGDEPEGYRAFATWEPVPTTDEARSFAEFWTWLIGRPRRRPPRPGRTFAAYCYNEQAENRWLLASARRFAGRPGIPAAGRGRGVHRRRPLGRPVRRGRRVVPVRARQGAQADRPGGRVRLARPRGQRGELDALVPRRGRDGRREPGPRPARAGCSSTTPTTSPPPTRCASG